MTGPEHYQKAEELLGYAEALDADQRGSGEDMSYMAEAHVHATLANAAATAFAALGSDVATVNAAWMAVINPTTPKDAL